jgi:hypothetical protein
MGEEERDAIKFSPAETHDRIEIYRHFHDHYQDDVRKKRASSFRIAELCAGPPDFSNRKSSAHAMVTNRAASLEAGMKETRTRCIKV